MATRKIYVAGREASGNDVAFNVVEDGAVIIEVDNGDRLRLKPIVINVLAGGQPGVAGRLDREGEHMTTAISTVSPGQPWGLDQPTIGFDVRTALSVVLAEAGIEGVESVRMLPRDHRHPNANHKVYFALATHDLARDERIVRLMMQFEGVDYDLVPVASVGMIPSAALGVF